jgi:hypothetical protein
VTLTGTGSIGAAGAPLLTSTASLTTTSGSDTYLANTGALTANVTGGNGGAVVMSATGDLTVNNVGATSGILGSVALTGADILEVAQAGSPTGPGNARLAIVANSVNLAATGTIGTPSVYLGLAANTITLSASSPQSIYVVASNANKSLIPAPPTITNFSAGSNLFTTTWSTEGVATEISELSALATLATISTTAGSTAKSLDFDAAESANSLVSLFDLVEPRVCLPADQREEDAPSNQGCGSTSKTGSKTASVKLPPPITRLAEPKKPTVVAYNGGE